MPPISSILRFSAPAPTPATRTVQIKNIRVPRFNKLEGMNTTQLNRAELGARFIQNGLLEKTYKNDPDALKEIATGWGGYIEALRILKSNIAQDNWEKLAPKIKAYARMKWTLKNIIKTTKEKSNVKAPAEKAKVEAPVVNPDVKATKDTPVINTAVKATENASVVNTEVKAAENASVVNTEVKAATEIL